MTREEVIIHYGGDTTAAERAIRGLSLRVKDSAKEMAASFGEPFKKLGSIFASAFTYAGIQELGQKFKELKHQAEAYGTSLQFVDGMQKTFAKAGADPEKAGAAMGIFVRKLGEVRTGVEASAKDFEKWGINIYDAAGNAMSTEALLPRVADKMASLEDPALRAAMAFDLFGRSGLALVPILAQGGAAVEAWKKKSRLTDEDVQQVIDLQMNLKLAGSAAESWAAKTINAIAKVAAALGHLSTGDVGKNGVNLKTLGLAAIPIIGPALAARYALKNVDQKPGGGEPGVGVLDPGRVMAQDRVEAARRAAQEADETSEQKLSRLQAEYARKQSQLEKMDAQSEQGLNKQAELLGIAKDIQKAEKEVAEERLKKEKEIAELRERSSKMEKQAMEAWQKASKDLATAQAERNTFTLAQLAGEGSDFDPGAGVRGGSHRRAARRAYNRWLNNVTPEEAAARSIAQGIQDAEANANALANAGHFYDAQAERDRALDLRSMLPEGFASLLDQDPFSKLRAEAESTNQKLQDLLDAATGAGINVNPANGP